MPSRIWEQRTSPGVSRSGCLSVELTSGSVTWFDRWAYLTGYLHYSCDCRQFELMQQNILNPWTLYKVLLWLLVKESSNVKWVHQCIFNKINYMISHSDEWSGHADDAFFINHKRVEVQSTNLRSNTTIIAGASDSIECSKFGGK